MENAGWRWVELKDRFNEENEARLFVLENMPRILTRYELHYFEDD